MIKTPKLGRTACA